MFALSQKQTRERQTKQESRHSLTSKIRLKRYREFFDHMVSNLRADPTPYERKSGAIYNINRSECKASYIGEISRNLRIRIEEQKRCLLWKGRTNNIAVHHMQPEHRIDWCNATFLARITNNFDCTFLESWYTNAEKNTNNICHEVPATYLKLVPNEERGNCERNTSWKVTPTWCLRQFIFSTSPKMITVKSKRRTNDHF